MPNGKYITVTCDTDGCGREYQTRADNPRHECDACRSSFYYWKKRRPAQILYRRGKLQLFANRLNEWFDKEGKKS